jgi:hypothetical protein
MRKYIGTLILAATLAGSTAACAGPLRVYDSPRQDYYRWNSGEERYYRSYLAERRRSYVEFRRLNRREQQRYWEWRHSRRDGRDNDRNRDRYREPDRDRDRDRDRR